MPAVRVLALLIILLHPVYSTAQVDEMPVRESGTAAVTIDSSRLNLPFSVTPLGPLFAVDPLRSQLGGELAIGPLRESHRLTLAETTFVFGPNSPALMVDEEIVQLSQPPRAAIGGLQVPLDLLRRIYTDLLGYDFSWDRTSRRLTITRRPLGEVPVAIQLIHFREVSNLVLRFGTRPRYRVNYSPGAIEIELLGDRLRLESGDRLPPDRFVHGVTVSGQKLRFRLSPGSEAESYTLERPFRLVFDVYERQRAPSVADVRPQRPKDRPGVHTIVIDPGHGGRDTGAISPSGVREKDLTLQVARLLESQLESRFPVRVVLTRSEDADLPLDTRTAIANQRKADLFISLHVNSANGPSPHGAETYFLSLDASDESAQRAVEAENFPGGAPPNGDALYDLQLILWDLAQSRHLARSQELAKLIQAELNVTLGLENRGVKQAPFRILMGAAMPAVLIELGFLSNPAEERSLQSTTYQGELAAALVRAIGRYRAPGLPAAADTKEPAP